MCSFSLVFVHFRMKICPIKHFHRLGRLPVSGSSPSQPGKSLWAESGGPRAPSHSCWYAGSQVLWVPLGRSWTRQRRTRSRQGGRSYVRHLLTYTSSSVDPPPLSLFLSLCLSTYCLCSSDWRRTEGVQVWSVWVNHMRVLILISFSSKRSSRSWVFRAKCWSRILLYL